MLKDVKQTSEIKSKISEIKTLAASWCSLLHILSTVEKRQKKKMSYSLNFIYRLFEWDRLSRNRRMKRIPFITQKILQNTKLSYWISTRLFYSFCVKVTFIFNVSYDCNKLFTLDSECANLNEKCVNWCLAPFLFCKLNFQKPLTLYTHLHFCHFEFRIVFIYSNYVRVCFL